MRAAAVLLACLSTTAFAADWSAIGSVQSGRASEARPGWLHGEFARFDLGSGQRFSHREFLRVGVEQELGRFRLVVNGVASKHGGAASSLMRAGLVEAFAEATQQIGDSSVTVRGGHFFLPTSREHREELWTSPFSVTPSAINSWIAHEVRPIGIDAMWSHTTPGSIVVSAAATAFGGNDASGALLAWRGWAFGDRVTPYGDDLPLVPLDAIDASFSEQRPATSPIGRDLDGRVGYSARARVALPQRALLQWTHYDNRGDRRLHRGEYAWATTFDVLGANLDLPTGTALAGEMMRGRTAMGERAAANVDARFSSSYVLISQTFTHRFRVTARYDTFEVKDLDGSIGGDDSEHGNALLFAAFFDASPRLRIGVEHLAVRGEDAVAARSAGATLDQQQTSVEVRIRM